MSESTDAIVAQIQGLQQQYRVTAHNLANVSTTGFKRRMTVFSSALAKQMGPDKAKADSDAHGQQITTKAVLDFSQGPMRHTERPLDVAIQGEGFFVVQDAKGKAYYTRNGTFRTNGAGQLVDTKSRLVLGPRGPITITPGTSLRDVHIAPNGNITAGDTPIGKLNIVKFEKPNMLASVGESCFLPTNEAAKPEAVAKAEVHQGFLEGSNVQAMEEVVGLVTVARLYETNMKSINLQDDQSKHLLQVALS